LGATQDLIAYARVQNLGRHHVDASAPEELRQLSFHGDETETWNMARFEFHKNIDVAVGTKVITKH
jgi:hypothetical protein